MHYIEYGTSAYRRVFLSMLFGSAVTFAVLYGPQTLIHTFSREFGIFPSTASLTVSLITFPLAFSLLLVSVFSNAWGRKKMMGISLYSGSLLSILAAFTSRFETLMFIRVVQGLLMGGFPATAITYLSEEIDPKNLGRIMGSYVGGTAIGAIIGRMIISAVTDFFTWETAFLVLGLFSFVCSVFFWFSLPESKHFKKTRISVGNWAAGTLRVFKKRELIILFGIGFMIPGAYFALFNYIGFPLSKPPFNLSQTVIGFLFISQFAGSVSSHIFGKLTEKVPRTFLISAALLLFLTGSFMTLSTNIFILVLGLVIFASGFFAGHTTATGWVGLLAPSDCKSYASSMYLLFFYIGTSFFGWAGGLFFSLFGWSGLIFMICGILFATGSLALMLGRSPSAQSIKANA